MRLECANARAWSRAIWGLKTSSCSFIIAHFSFLLLKPACLVSSERLRGEIAYESDLSPGLPVNPAWRTLEKPSKPLVSASRSTPSRALLACLRNSLGYTFCVSPADRCTQRSKTVSALARGLPVALPQCRGDSGSFH